MKKQPRNILITGVPGVGKTTCIRRVCDLMADSNAVGFFTQEIREGGVRRGFQLVTLNGRRSLLSHVDLDGPDRVGKYGVDVTDLERLLDSIAFFDPGIDMIVIDEIGKMECLSSKFTSLLRRLFDASVIVLASVARKGSGAIAEVKDRGDVILLEINRGNREHLPSDIVKLLSGLAGNGSQKGL